MIKLDGDIQEFMSNLAVGDTFPMVNGGNYSSVVSCEVKKVTPTRVTIEIDRRIYVFTKKDGRRYGDESSGYFRSFPFINMKNLQASAIENARKEERVAYLADAVQKRFARISEVRGLGLEKLEAILAILDGQK